MMMAKQPSDEVRRRVAHVVSHLRSVSEGSGCARCVAYDHARDSRAAALTVLRKSLP